MEITLEQDQAEVPKRARKNMEKLGGFMGAVKAEYKDLGNREKYTFYKKGGRKIVLFAEGNSADGGYLLVGE